MSSSTSLPQPITLIINTHSRRGQAQFEAAIAALQSAGVPLAETHAVRDQDEMVRLLELEVAKGGAVVIIGGGDGTLSQCAGHLVHTPVAMGVLPLGTGNTLARSLGIPLDLEGAARTIAGGQVQTVDVGKVNGRVFLNSVTLGLSCEIAHALDGETKKRLGLLAWPIIGGRVLWTHRALVLKVTSPQRTFHVRTHQLVVANGRYVAGPVAAAPDASLQSREFDVFVLGGAKHLDLARAAWQWLRGRHVNDPKNRFFSTRSLRIEAVRRRVPADVDGEINERTPLDLEVLPDALRVVVPQGFDAATV